MNLLKWYNNNKKKKYAKINNNQQKHFKINNNHNHNYLKINYNKKKIIIFKNQKINHNNKLNKRMIPSLKKQNKLMILKKIIVYLKIIIKMIC